MRLGEIGRSLATLTTPVVADACLRLRIPARLAPPGLAPVIAGSRIAGRVLPARHTGSVDVFLEAFGAAEPGDVLVIDNGGRRDEGCIGDLTALEVRAAGLSGILVWGSHRDTAELLAVGLPVFSSGVFPSGPHRLDPRPPDALASARFGEVSAGPRRSSSPMEMAPSSSPDRAPRRFSPRRLASRHRARPRRRRGAGRTLREQLSFDAYLARRAAEPAYGFREHLRRIGGAIEE